MKSLVIFFASMALMGCTNGSSTAQISASVTEGSCVNMTTGSYCTITLNYNPNGVSSAALTYTPNPLENGFISNNSFITTFNQCAQQISSSTNAGTCNVSINYTTVGEQESQSLVFYLSGQASTPIVISGD